MLPLALLFALTMQAADLPVGQVVADVRCAADASQGYALYLPSGYTPDRRWPILLAFDPGARGSVPVERYQAAAERYGWIVVGSNNSRNGSTEVSKAIAALSADVASRFRLNPDRVYTAGMSGGARVAMSVALSVMKVAGVIASSGGYPDGRPRATSAFPIFATAGTEDFNHLEMRLLDTALITPHRLAIFDGGHVWLSSDLAMEAVEWMEVQAMKTGLAPRDQNALDRLFQKRLAAADARPSGGADTYLALQGIAADFSGLTDVSVVRARADRLGRDDKVRDALRQALDEDESEQRTFAGILSDERRLATGEERTATLASLERQWKALSERAKQSRDSSERRVARRVLSGLAAGMATKDPDYLKIIAPYRLAVRP